MYGHTLRGAVGLGYVECATGCSDEFVLSGHFEIQVHDRRVAARASLTPLYDPKSLRVRA
jgi:4-methylaminobutanoate oxidase (formaldehyde-forming)